jgi:LuxR family transcriptional regulator, maltose regulon positive regulatory protein
MTESTTARRGVRFALAKFRPPALPATLVARPALHELLSASSGRRLAVVVGSAGAGKSVLLADWAAARPPGTTSWLSCDQADADPIRFWSAFIEAPRIIEPGFGTDAADLLAMDGRVSADVMASVANDAAKLPAGSAVIVDDFHYAAARDMAGLVERWPAKTVQLVLSSRSDPPLRQHRLRMSGDLCEIRDRELYFSLAESRDLLANLGAQLSDSDLAVLHQRSEGWVAALQMAALSLRGTGNPAQVARALDVGNRPLAEYFVSEVLDQQPPEVARFMLDTSVLEVLTADACAAVTGRQDAAAVLRGLDAAHLFLVALEDDRTSFRYHHLVRQVLRAETKARDPAREQALQLRAAEWFGSRGETRRAAHHFLAAQQADRALTVLQDGVVPDYLREPVLPTPPDLSAIDPSLLTDAPERLLALAADLVLGGDTARSGQYLDLLEHAQKIPAASGLASRFAVIRSYQYGVTGQLDKSVQAAETARAIQESSQLTDEWNAAIPAILIRVYNCLEDFTAAEREADAAVTAPDVTDPVKLVMVPGALALAWFESGHLDKAACAAEAAQAEARRLGFGQHFFAVDYLRVLCGLALERRDLDSAEHLAERALSITEQRRPAFEFLALLDRARIWAARGMTRDALTTVAAARQVLDGTGSVLLSRADELEALIRLSLGDLRSAAELADGLAAARGSLLRASIALAAGEHRAAQDQLRSASLGEATPRQTLVREILLAAAAIERGDPAAGSIVGGVLHAARQQGFLNTVVSTAPQVTSYLIEHAPGLRSDPFLERLTAAAMQQRTAQPAARHGHRLAEPLTAAEHRILELLPTSTYLQMAATLCVSRNTVKTHLRSIYQKLGVASRSEAIQRAIDLRLL